MKQKPTIYFVVREWNLSFFLKLSELIAENKLSERIVLITLSVYVKWKLKNAQFLGIEWYYLPDELKKVEIEDSLVDELEEKLYGRFGFGLNRMFDIERLKPNLVDETFIKRHALALLSIINQPGVLFSLTMDHFGFILAGIINEIQGGKSFYLQPVGFPNNSFILMKNLWEIYTNIEGFGTDDIQLDEYRKSLDKSPEESVWYMAKNYQKISFRKRLAHRIKRYREKEIIRQLKNMTNEYSYFDDYFYYKTVFTGEASKKKTKSKPEYDYQQFISKFKVNGRKIFYYPLHLEPEMSILGYSPFFQNQLDVIKLISKSLKMGDILLVKENPKSLPRSEYFYSETDKLHNLVWIKVGENSRDLIRASDKVITLTGTASIEALFLKVNAMLFGFPPYFKFLPQASVSQVKLVDFSKELYTFYDEQFIESRLSAAWKEYSKAIVQIDIRPKSNPESALQHTYLPDAEIKAKEFFDKVLLKCAAY